VVFSVFLVKNAHQIVYCNTWAGLAIIKIILMFVKVLENFEQNRVIFKVM
jgi:hypothetical protein